MLLCIDAGNTNIVFALYEGEICRHVWRCRTEAARTADEYASFLQPLFAAQSLEFNVVKDAIIGSVVPVADFNLKKLCLEMTGREPLMVAADAVPIKINLPKPEEVGADRLINAYAAIESYNAPVIVIDFGTATTFDVINGRGEYCGGVIAPGINLSAQALHQAAAKLPRVEIKKPSTVIGTGTVGAIQSGLYWGYVSLIEGILTRIMTEMNARPSVVATGGLAGLLAESIPAIRTVDEDLTLRGLLCIYRHHQAGSRQTAA